MQRTLAAKNVVHAKGGAVLAGAFKLLPLWLMVFPGMAAKVFYPNEIGCAHPDVCYEFCKSRTGCSNMAYPTLVLNLMPQGKLMESFRAGFFVSPNSKDLKRKFLKNL